MDQVFRAFSKAVSPWLLIVRSLREEEIVLNEETSA